MSVLFQLNKLYPLKESFMRLSFRTLKSNNWFKPFASLTGTG